jgi:benzoyl-CoA 2,3-dioxygenase component A
MEVGVVHPLRDDAQRAGLAWDTLGPALRRDGRLHLETY